MKLTRRGLLTGLLGLPAVALLGREKVSPLDAPFVVKNKRVHVMSSRFKIPDTYTTANPSIRTFSFSIPENAVITGSTLIIHDVTGAIDLDIEGYSPA